MGRIIEQKCRCRTVSTKKEDHPEYPWINYGHVCADCGETVILEIKDDKKAFVRA